MLRKGWLDDWWLEKIQWNFIIWKRRFLQPAKHGRYYWFRLHAWKTVYKDFEIKHLREYHDLYIKSNTYC